MAQPTDPLIIWATNNIILPVSGQSNKVKPQTSLIETGWDKTQKPTCEEFNYVLNNFALWIEYYGIENITSLLQNYMRKDQNLNDLSNKTTARTNLDVFSTSQVNSKQVNTGAGLQGGGDLSTNRTISIATPSTVGNGSSNSATNGGSPTHTHALDVTGNVAVLTGTITTGNTIPLPSGYSEAQCRWTAAVATVPNASGGSDGNFSLSLAGRQVNMSFDDGAGTGMVANYIIIGVK